MSIDAFGQAPAVPEWTIGDRLRKARENAGLEQGELADAIGAARNTISNYETGRSKPKAYILAQWALITEVPVEWLHGPLIEMDPATMEAALEATNIGMTRAELAEAMKADRAAGAALVAALRKLESRLPRQRGTGTGSQPGSASDNLGVTGRSRSVTAVGNVIPFPSRPTKAVEQDTLAPVIQLQPRRARRAAA